MDWKKISKILAGVGTIGVVGLLSYLFLLTGVDYTHSGDTDCKYIKGIYQCEAFINVTTNYWNFGFEYLDIDSYIYLPIDLVDFKGKLIKYKVSELNFTPVLYKKSINGRKLWVNLNQINDIIETNPNIKVEWFVPAVGKDNWRPVKEGDTWDRLKNNRIKLIGYPDNQFETIKWSFIIGEINIDPVWNAIEKDKFITTKKKIDGKDAVEIIFNNLTKDYNLKDEVEKNKDKTTKDYLNIKKTLYSGDADIKLMHYITITLNDSYRCECRNETIEYPAIINGTNTTDAYNITEEKCNVCYEESTKEVLTEIDPDTFVLRNNEPIYEVFEKSTKWGKTNNGWGYSVWTDVTIMGENIEGATWWNASWEKKKEIQINNTALEVANYSLLLNVTYNANMNTDFSDLRFANGSEDTELGYWIENKTNSEHADVWVKIPYTLTNTTNTTIYMYYKNASEVSSTSNGENAFLDWHGTSAIDYLDPLVIVPMNIEFQFVGNIIDEGFFGLSNQQITNTDDNFAIRPIQASNLVVIYTANEATFTQVNVGATFSAGTHRIKGTYDGTIFRSYFDGVAKGTSTTNIPNENLGLYMDVIRVGGTSNLYYSFARKYLSTTPTYSFGAEESNGGTNYSVDSCGELSTAGTYTMVSSITDSSTSPCMEITTNDVIFDCNGHTIDGDDDASYCIYSYGYDNITIKNCILSDWYYAGVVISNGDNNTINNVTSSSSSTNHGIAMLYSNYNNITNNTLYLNKKYGLYMIHSNYNNISNIYTYSNNGTGITIMGDSDYNNISNSIIYNNTDYGIYISEYLDETYPNNTLIYNNLLNNTINYYDNYNTIDTYLNTTKQLGTREYSYGNYIGGNYWSDSDGNYSDICIDSDYDGFCDTPYSPVSGVTDYLPYSDEGGMDYSICNSDSDCISENCDIAWNSIIKYCHPNAVNCVNETHDGEETDGLAICLNITHFEDCSSGTWGVDTHVTTGDVCIESASGSQNPDGDSDCGYNSIESCSCETQLDCVTDACYADQYYTGYDSGACTDTGWVDQGTNWNTDANYIISVTNHATVCTKTNTGKSPSYDDCDNQYTRRGPDGYCDGAGALDTNDASTPVQSGYVCKDGLNTTVSVDTNCGSGDAEDCYCAIWYQCVTGACTKPEYYTGFDAGVTCIDTNWQSKGTSINVAQNATIAITEHAISCTENTNNYCGLVQCDEDANIPYYYGWDETYTCNYMNDTMGYCDGSGNCDSYEYSCPDSISDGSTGIICDSSIFELACSDVTIGSCQNGVFDITETSGTVFKFYANHPTQLEVEPYGQTSTVGMFTINNNLTYTIDIYAKLNETTNGVTLKLNDEYDYDTSVSINTSYQLIYDDLEVDETEYLWVWADFNNLQSQWNPELYIVGVA